MSSCAKRSCITSKCSFSATYESGEWLPSSVIFTPMSSHAKRSYITSECLFSATHESSEWLPISVTFTLMLSCARRSFITSKCPFAVVYESGEHLSCPSYSLWCHLVPKWTLSLLNACFHQHRRVGNDHLCLLHSHQHHLMSEAVALLLNVLEWQHVRVVFGPCYPSSWHCD